MHVHVYGCGLGLYTLWITSKLMRREKGGGRREDGGGRREEGEGRREEGGGRMEEGGGRREEGGGRREEGGGRMEEGGGRREEGGRRLTAGLTSRLSVPPWQSSDSPGPAGPPSVMKFPHNEFHKNL